MFQPLERAFLRQYSPEMYSKEGTVEKKGASFLQVWTTFVILYIVQ
jgi:hypothetical protein